MADIIIKTRKQLKELNGIIKDAGGSFFINQPIPKNLTSYDIQLILFLKGLEMYLAAHNIKAPLTIDVKALVKENV